MGGMTDTQIARVKDFSCKARGDRREMSGSAWYRLRKRENPSALNLQSTRAHSVGPVLKAGRMTVARGRYQPCFAPKLESRVGAL